ncbi:hypothetical protein GH741_09695 [Aquibacillus halophilus]|uniref:Uncharacterized protein n=1 Tax=Aquibacillus halophilus TaxID=930132 RepID=A0A6A8DJ23_9BACI|nr:hypothetical protein [Aquibacillus halophilus]MRH42957.1 hypothetical protein [Aquibacillus halophilus]
MKESTVKKIRSILLHTLVILVSLVTSYTVVYTFQYLPKGYEIISKEEASITLKSNNIIGIEEEIIGFNPPDKQQSWKMEYLVNTVNEQELYLFLFFITALASIFLFVYRLNKGEKFSHSLFKSGIGAALIALLPYIQTLDRIDSILYSI